jgi:DNA polymerase-3 subunit alpha
MTKRVKSTVPFVNLHAHTTAGSVFDAIGYADEHFDFCYSNGGDAMAITDHGNMNSLPLMFLHSKKMKAEGKDFKPIFGVEAYFLPSIEEWRGEYNRIKEDAKLAKSLAKSDTSGATVEDEEESKKAIKSILNRRRHLVLLAQNQTGLNNLFKLISESYNEENYYRYPRVDYKMLDKYSEGIIAASACLTGDSILDTSKGQMRLDDVVRNYKQGNELFVLSYSEEEQRLVYRRVLWGDLTRKKAKIIRIKTKDGKSVRLTPDHKVFTDQGWMEAGDLKKHKNIKILSLK